MRKWSGSGCHAAAERRWFSEAEEGKENSAKHVTVGMRHSIHAHNFFGPCRVCVCILSLAVPLSILVFPAAEAFTLLPTHTLLSKPAYHVRGRQILYPLQLRAETAQHLPKWHPLLARGETKTERGESTNGLHGSFAPWRIGAGKRATSSVEAAQGKGMDMGEIEVFDVNLDGSGQAKVVWDDKQRRFMKVKVRDGDYKSGNSRTQVVRNEFTQLQFSGSSFQKKLKSYYSRLKQSFLPRGVTEDYYRYTMWRIAQVTFTRDVCLLCSQVRWAFSNSMGLVRSMLSQTPRAQTFHAQTQR